MGDESDVAFTCPGTWAAGTDEKCGDQSGGCTAAECCVPGTKTCDDIDGLEGGNFSCPGTSTDATDRTCASQDGCTVGDCCVAASPTCGDTDGLAGGAFNCGLDEAKAADTACSTGTCDAATCCTAVKSWQDSAGDESDVAFTCPGTSTAGADAKCGEQSAGCTAAECCDAASPTCGDTDGLAGGAFDCGLDDAKAADTACTVTCDAATCCTT